MAVYVKWNTDNLESGSEALRDVMVRLTALAEDLRSVYAQLDVQMAGYEGIGNSLRMLAEGLGEDANRVRNEYNALESVISIYMAAQRDTMRESESLPNSIAERSLIFETWFSDLLY